VVVVVLAVAVGALGAFSAMAHFSIDLCFCLFVFGCV